MFTINNQNSNIKKYISNKYDILPETIDKIISYIDKGIKNIEEKKFIIEKEKYLLVIKSFNTKNLLSIFDKNKNYIILSNTPEKWNIFKQYNISGSPNPNCLKGIFMNTSNIDYTKFNDKLINLKKQFGPNVVLINDCSHYIDLNKIQINAPIFDVLHSTSIINLFYYDKIIINVEPYILNLLQMSNLFDKILRKEMEKFIDKTLMDGNYNYLLIDNKDLTKKKYSKIYYLVQNNLSRVYI